MSKVGGNIVCAQEVPRERTASYGIITPGARDGRLTEVKGLVEKPQPEDAPSTLGRRRPLHPPARDHADPRRARQRRRRRDPADRRHGRPDRRPAVPRPHLRRRAPRLRRQDRLRHRQSRAGARRRRRRAGRSAPGSPSGDDLSPPSSSATARSAASAPKRRSPIEGPGFLWTHVESDGDELPRWSSGRDIPDVAANALVATETRPRCDRIDQGAIVNLRGPAAVETDNSRPAGLDPDVGAARARSIR